MSAQATQNSMLSQVWQGTAVAVGEWCQTGSKAVAIFIRIKDSPSALAKALSITRHAIVLLSANPLAKLALSCGFAETVIDLSQTFGPLRYLDQGRPNLKRIENASWSIVNLANAGKWLSDTKILFIGRFSSAAGWMTAGTFVGFTALGLSTAIVLSNPEANRQSKSARLAWCIAEVALIVFPMVMTISAPVLTGGIIVAKSLALASFVYEQKV